MLHIPSFDEVFLVYSCLTYVVSWLWLWSSCLKKLWAPFHTHHNYFGLPMTLSSMKDLLKRKMKNLISVLVSIKLQLCWYLASRQRFNNIYHAATQLVPFVFQNNGAITQRQGNRLNHPNKLDVVAGTGEIVRNLAVPHSCTIQINKRWKRPIRRLLLHHWLSYFV